MQDAIRVRTYRTLERRAMLGLNHSGTASVEIHRRRGRGGVHAVIHAMSLIIALACLGLTNPPIQAGTTAYAGVAPVSGSLAGPAGSDNGDRSWSLEAGVAPRSARTDSRGGQLALTARAAFAVDLSSGVELYSANADEPLPPASTTKIVTALVVAQRISLAQRVTVEPGDLVDPLVYSNMSLQAGDDLSVHDLLAGMLINSAGDAANALARTVGSQLQTDTQQEPVRRFVGEMNRFARSHGMHNSTFINPSGDDEPGHVSSARDLAIAASLLFQHVELERMVAARTRTIAIGGPNARELTLYNTNDLLAVPSVHGVKTGTTDAAGECLVLATRRGDSRIVTVILGSSQRYADSQELLNSLDERFRWVRLGRSGDLADLNTTLAERGYSLATGRTFLLTKHQAETLHYEIHEQASPDSSRWSVQGSVVFSIDGESILRLPLFRGDPTRAGRA